MPGPSGRRITVFESFVGALGSNMFKDGVLFQQWLALKGRQSYLQLVIPSVLKRQVLDSAHLVVPSGHLGVNKIASKIQRMFY